MLTIQQRIAYAAAALAAHRGTTSDQVLDQVLGNQVRPEIEQLRLLEYELAQLRPPVPTPVGNVRNLQLYSTTGGHRWDT